MDIIVPRARLALHMRYLHIIIQLGGIRVHSHTNLHPLGPHGGRGGVQETDGEVHQLETLPKEAMHLA